MVKSRALGPLIWVIATVALLKSRQTTTREAPGWAMQQDLRRANGRSTRELVSVYSTLALLSRRIKKGPTC